MCDQKANPKYRGVANTTALTERKAWASKARKYRSHLLWMTEFRRRVLDIESDNMADMVLSQGGTSVSNKVVYEYKSNNGTRRPLVCSAAATSWDRTCYRLEQRTSIW